MGTKVPFRVPCCNLWVLLKAKVLVGNYPQLLGNNDCF